MVNKQNHISQLHDQFFYATFQDKKNAIDLLKTKLPQAVSSQIDFSHFEIANPTHHEKKKYRKIHSDLVIKTKLKNSDTPADIYILFEHKTNQKRSVLFQLLSYMTAMWEEDIKNAKSDKKTLCFRPIIPFVFYHGRREWKIPTTFSDLYCCGDDLKEHLLSFSYTLFDTTHWKLDSEERKQLNEELILHILLFHAAFKNSRESLISIFNELSKFMGKTNDKELLMYLVTYVSQSRNLDFEEIKSLMKESDMDEEAIMNTVGTMDVAEIWRRDGKEKGREEGREEERIAVAKQMLLEGADVQFVARVTKLSIKEIQQIKKSLH